MKKNYLLIAAAFTCFIENVNAQSPNWLWAKGIGGTGYDIGNSIAVDASGNVYTTGWFTGTVDFDPGAGIFNLTSAGLQDIFISKLDGSGNFVWAKRMGSGTDDDLGYSIAIDLSGSGDVHTTGYFQGTVDFDPGVGTFNITAAGFYGDIFISRLDNSGNFVWAKAMGGTSNDFGYSIALDPAGSGDIYTTGLFQETVDFDPGAGVFNLTSAGLLDIFISKLNSSGNFVWAKAWGGTSNDECNSIALDPAGSGNVYSTGYFRVTADFDPGVGVFNLTSAGDDDIFISKLDSSGNFVWAKRMGGLDYDRGYSIAIDLAGSGDVYSTGYFEGTVDFDPGAGTFNLTSAGWNDIFISKLNSSGNFIWANQIGGTFGDFGYSIDIDVSGNVFTVGTFQGTADFDPGVGVFNLTSAGDNDIFISKLDGSGNFVWAKSMGGTGNELFSSITLDASGYLYMGGVFFSPTISFGSTTLTNAGDGDIFIAKLDTLSNPTGNNEIENFGNSILLFPNPATNHLTIALGSNNKKVEVTITDITGKIIYTTTATETQKIEVNTKDFAEGVYVVRIQAEDFIETRKLIVAK